MRQGRLNNSANLAHKKRVNHAGYTRGTISTNPPLVDDDGDVLSPHASDDESAPAGEPVAEDPFAGVQLESLLAPLTAASGLADHPSLSLAYKSNALSQMAEQALEMVRKERESLWRAKRMLTRLRGDADWMPCGRVEADGDELLLQKEVGEEGLSAVPSIVAGESVPDGEQNVGQAQQSNGNGNSVGGEAGASGEQPSTGPEDKMEGVETADMAQNKKNEEGETEEANEHDGATKDAPGTDKQQAENGVDRVGVQEPLPHPSVADARKSAEPNSENTSQSGGGSVPSHQMTTRARARSPVMSNSPSPAPSDGLSSIPPIHPWFLAPASSHPDRDLGLPLTEAEDTRKLLLLYCQKQEQIVRECESLASGLLKADRLRHDVWRWCKAEGHVVPDGKGNMVTEMADGEDWYDVEEWGLLPQELQNGELEKGKDEVEEEADGGDGGRRGGRRKRIPK